MEFAESVMIESLPAVATSAMCGMSSIASLPNALPSAMPFDEQPRRDAMRGRHAVADEQDHVLGLARTGRVDRPCDLARLRAVGDANPVVARFRQRNVAQDQRRLVLAVLAFDKSGWLSEDLGIVFPVQRDRDVRWFRASGELDLEVEARAGEDLGAVDRIDRLRMAGRSGNTS